MPSPEKVTALAKEMGVRYSQNLRPLTPATRRKLNEILRDLDVEERATLVLLNAAGGYDWHMVDGVRRVWHFTESGHVGWNNLSDRSLDQIVAQAESLIGREIEY
jgi:hypothetical protein